MLRPVGLCAAILFAAAGAAVALETTTLLSVSCDKASGRMSLEANGATLSEILRQVEKQCGVRFRMDGDADRQVTIRFKALSVENGLRYLGEEASLNYILFVSKESASAPPGSRNVTEMRVIGSGKGGGSSAPPPAAAASSTQPQPPVAESASRPAPAPASGVMASTEPVEDTPAQTVRERMERRLKNLPPEEREKKIQEEEERQRKREERNAAAKARREARRNAMGGGAPAGE